MKISLLFLLLAVPVCSYGQRPADDYGGRGYRKDLIDIPVRPITDTIVASVMPAPGYDIDKYLTDNIKYPEQASKKKIQGRVSIQFTVNKDGPISDCKAISHVGAGFEEEAIQVLQIMPKWNPATENGKPVKTTYTMPVTFRLP